MGPEGPPTKARSIGPEGLP
ncbi:hypothetical protein [Lysobacter gummosus]